MKRDLKDVEIVEPPIQELYKKKNGFGRACLAGFILLLLFCGGLILGVKLYIGAGPKQLKTMPSDFPSSVPIYDEYDIYKISRISGRYKSRGMEVASFFPKVILSPVVISLSKNQTPNQSDSYRFWNIITTPITNDDRDTLQIEWRDLTAEPSFLIDFYKSKLKEQGAETTIEKDDKTIRQLSFLLPNGDNGLLQVENNPGENKVSYASLLVNFYPINK